MLEPLVFPSELSLIGFSVRVGLVKNPNIYYSLLLQPIHPHYNNIKDLGWYKLVQEGAMV